MPGFTYVRVPTRFACAVLAIAKANASEGSNSCARKLTHHRAQIGVLEFAEKLSCHPTTIPRLSEKQEGFPQPAKLLNKNTWEEDVADAYIASLIK